MCVALPAAAVAPAAVAAAVAVALVAAAAPLAAFPAAWTAIAVRSKSEDVRWMPESKAVPKIKQTLFVEDLTLRCLGGLCALSSESVEQMTQ